MTVLTDVSPAVTVAGYAYRFDDIADPPRERYPERIAPGAADQSIAAGTVAALYRHDPTRTLAHQSDNTLRLHEDHVGLRFELDLPDTHLGRHVATLLATGELRAASFGFHTLRSSVSEIRSRRVRTIEEIRLHEVSLVPTGAYRRSTITTHPRTTTHTEDEARAHWMDHTPAALDPPATK